MNEAQCLPTACINLSAFCPVRPEPDEVGALLGKLGFRLVFQMDEQRDHASLLPSLPAQYHYRDESGTEAIYLTGRDFPLHEDGRNAYPPHQSRFWLSCGANQQAFTLTAATLSLAWDFAWQPESPDNESDDDEELLTLSQEVA
jgi:hypothetical protein